MKKLLKGVLSLVIAASVGSPQINAATNDYSIEVKSKKYSKHSRSTNPLYGITYTEDDATYTDQYWPLVELYHPYYQSNGSYNLAKHQMVRQFGVSMGVVYWINPAENYIYWWNTVTGESGRTTPTKSYGVGYQDGINNPNFDFTFKGAETGSGAIAHDWYGNLVHMWNDGMNGWGTTAGTHFVQGYAVYKAAKNYGELMDFTPKLSKMNDTGRQNYPFYQRKVTGAAPGTLEGGANFTAPIDQIETYYDKYSPDSKTPNPNYPANEINWGTNYDFHKANTSIAKQPTDFLGVSGNLWGKGVLQGATVNNVALSAFSSGWSTGQVFHMRNDIAYGNMFADGQYTNWYLNYRLTASNPTVTTIAPNGYWVATGTAGKYLPADAAFNNYATEYLFREADVLEYFWSVPQGGLVEYDIKDRGGYQWNGYVYTLYTNEVDFYSYCSWTQSRASDAMSAPAIDSIKGTRVMIHNKWLQYTPGEDTGNEDKRDGSFLIRSSKYSGGMNASSPVFTGDPTQTYNFVGLGYGYNKTPNVPEKYINTGVNCWSELERVNNNVFALYTHVPGQGFSKSFITAVKPNNPVSDFKVANQYFNGDSKVVNTLSWTPQPYDRESIHRYEIWYRKKKTGTSTYEDTKSYSGTSRAIWVKAGVKEVTYSGSYAAGGTFTFDHVAQYGGTNVNDYYDRDYEYMIIPIYDASSHRGTESDVITKTSAVPDCYVGGTFKQATETDADGVTRYSFNVKLDPVIMAGTPSITTISRMIIEPLDATTAAELKKATGVTASAGTATANEGSASITANGASVTTSNNYYVEVTGFTVGTDGKLPSIVWHNVDPDITYNVKVYVEDTPTAFVLPSSEPITASLEIPYVTLSLTEASVYPLVGDYSSLQNNDLLPLGAKRKVGSNEVTNPVTLSNANTLGTKGSAINPLLVTDEVMENWSVEYKYNIFKGGEFLVAFELDASDEAGGATYYSNEHQVIFDIVGLPVERTAWDIHTQMGLSDEQKAINENITKYGYNTSTAGYNYTAHVDVTFTRKDNSEITAYKGGEQDASSPIVFSEAVTDGSIFPNLGVSFGTQFVPIKRDKTHWDENCPEDAENNFGYYTVYYDAVAQWKWDEYADNLNRYVGFHAVTSTNCVGHYVNNSSTWIPYYAPSVLSDYYVDQTNITLGKDGNFTDNYNGEVEPLVMVRIGYDGTNNWSALAAEARTLPMEVHYVWGGNRDLTNEESDRKLVSTKVLMTADYPIIESTYGATIIHNAVAAINDEDSYYTLIPETNAGETRMNMVSSENHSGVYADYVAVITGVEGILTDACGGWNLYPNPVGSTFTLQAPMTIGKVKIFTMDGQLVKVVKDVNDSTAKINVEDLPQGMYIVNTLGIAKMMIKM